MQNVAFEPTRLVLGHHHHQACWEIVPKPREMASMDGLLHQARLDLDQYRCFSRPFNNQINFGPRLSCQVGEAITSFEILIEFYTLQNKKLFKEVAAYQLHFAPVLANGAAGGYIKVHPNGDVGIYNCHTTFTGIDVVTFKAEG